MNVRILEQKDYPKECLNPSSGKNEMCVATCVQMMCEQHLNFRWSQRDFYHLMLDNQCIGQSGYVNSYEKCYFILSKNRKWYQKSDKKDWVFTTNREVIIKALQDRPVILFVSGHAWYNAGGAVLAIEYLPARGLFSVVDPYLKPEQNPVLLQRPIKRAGFYL
jgi:hypothetical protein